MTDHIQAEEVEGENYTEASDTQIDGFVEELNRHIAEGKIVVTNDLRLYPKD